ncbi:hypothetical protein KC343_g48 [Hortaea werneckii]|nr:hypothetical protein KC317_g47 [Hortaea werneckii]KAI7628656.1 hypothetical protein KC346_g51 [Hortaea werneckii]KAI7638450.1 hypothetical protein KC343_g48 [Hortaea werneckii]
MPLPSTRHFSPQRILCGNTDPFRTTTMDSRRQYYTAAFTCWDTNSPAAFPGSQFLRRVVLFGLETFHEAVSQHEIGRTQSPVEVTSDSPAKE